MMYADDLMVQLQHTVNPYSPDVLFISTCNNQKYYICMYDPYFHMISSSTHTTPVKVHVVHVSTNKQALPLSVQLGVYIAYAK